MVRIQEDYCEAENFAINEIKKNARAEKRERKLMDRKIHKKSAHSGKKYAGFEYNEEEEQLLREYGF